MNFLFWCEFPDRMDWEKLNDVLEKNDFSVRIGIACTSKEDYQKKAAFLSRYEKIELVRAWPTLPKEKGYWFSSFTEKEDIDTLDQYRGMSIKIDVEPPLPLVPSYKEAQWYLYLWFSKMFFTKGKQKKYLQEKINSLSEEGDVMLSTFSFPLFFLKRLGLVLSKKCSYNYIHYSSFIPLIFKPLYKLYMTYFIKRRLAYKADTHIAVGLITPGIFDNEPCYKNSAQLEDDLYFLSKMKVKNVVVFRLGSLIEKKNITPWIAVLKRFQNKKVYS